MNEPLATQQPVSKITRGRPEWLPQPRGERLSYIVKRRRTEKLTVIGHERAVRCPAQGMRLLQDRVEHRFEVSRRGIDHLKDFGGRGLLLQSLARLCDEPRILHRDHRLSREV